MASWQEPTPDRVEGYFKELNNWDRWGSDDQVGTVNLITVPRPGAGRQHLPGTPRDRLRRRGTLRVFIYRHATAARWQHRGSSTPFGDFLGQAEEGQGHEYPNAQN